MTSQLDERPAQTHTSTPERNESPSGPPTWIVTTAAVAGLVLGVGLFVAGTRTDSARSPVGKVEQADAPAPEVNGGVLPLHLQEFDERTKAASPDGAVDRSAYLIIQDEIDAALTGVAAKAGNNRRS